MKNGRKYEETNFPLYKQLICIGNWHSTFVAIIENTAHGTFNIPSLLMSLPGEGRLKLDLGGHGVVEELDELLFTGGTYPPHRGGLPVKLNNGDVLGLILVKVADCRLQNR